ncbi:MAG: pyridoxal-phosphate dependent enzyme [Candidatus Odinarchaeota archaeon]
MLECVKAAAQRIESVVNHTPVMTSRTLDTITGSKNFFKCENFQRVGAFKFRGAYNAISQLSPEDKAQGVITHSSGNHAQAVALASKLLGVKATIVMPLNAPPVKKTATSGYGADIIECEPHLRAETAQELIEKHGYTLIHPYNNLDVIYGAGTGALELINETGNLDVVLAPVGGGGLLSGTSIATKGLCPSAKVYGIEPANADDAYRSFKAGKIFPSINPRTIADGLRTQLEANTFRIIRQNVDDIITVTEDQIIEAMRFLWERMKLVVEPSGAVPLAGLLYGGINIQDKRVGLIISGGNIELTAFFSLLEDQVAEIAGNYEKSNNSFK